MITYLHQVRSFSRDVRLYLLTAVAIGFAFDGGIYSVIFNLYLLRLGYGPEFVGQINSAGLFAFALSSVPAGTLGSRFGSRKMMILGLWLMLSGCTVLPLAEFAPAGWLAGWLMAMYMLIMLGLSLYFVNAAPFLMRTAKPDNRNHIFSAQMAAMALAAFVGSLVGGYMPALFAGLLDITLAQAAAYRYPLLLAAVLLLPALLIMRATEADHNFPADADETTAEQGHQGGLWGRLATWPLMLLSVLVLVRFFQVAGVAVMFIFFNVYLDDGLHISTAQIGWLAALGRLVSAGAALLTPTVTARFGHLRAVIWLSVGVAVAILPMAALPHWATAGFGYAVALSLSSMRFPAFMVYSMELVRANLRGPLVGAGEMSAGLSFTVIALSGGYMITTWGYPSLFVVGALLTAFGAFLFWLYFRVPRGELARPVVVNPPAGQIGDG